MPVAADIWRSLAGIAIFLLGMNFLEEGLKHVAGRPFKLFLRKQTTNNFKAIIGGMVVAAILQSSSIVNLVILAFVGSGVIRMQNALALILGANLGSTFTSWVIATVGFSFNLENLALPVAAVSGILMMLTNKEGRWYHWCKLLFGFGFLFIGLSYIKTGIENSFQHFDFNGLNEQPLVIFLLTGFIITALVQSSSVTMAIALSALHANAISLFAAMAIVLGSEAGTAIKLILVSLKGIAAKKRVALGNLLFNVAGTIIVFILLDPVNTLITDIAGIRDNLIALVFFQSLVNLISIILFYPFLNIFGKFLEKQFVTGGYETLLTSKIKTDDNDLALDTLEKETGRFINNVLHFAASAFETQYSMVPDNQHKKFEKKNLQEKYEHIKVMHGDIQRFSVGLKNDQADEKGNARLAQLLSSARNGMYAAKNIRDTFHDIEQLRNSSNETKYNFYVQNKEKIVGFCSHVSQLMDERDNGKNFEKITRLYKEVQQGYTDSIRELYKEGMIRQLALPEISTLINFNREMYTAFKSFLFSLKDYLLSAEEADRFDELPGFIR